MTKRTLRSRKRTMEQFLCRFSGCNDSIKSTVSYRELRTSVIFQSAHTDRLAQVEVMASNFPGVVATVQTSAGRLEVCF